MILSFEAVDERIPGEEWERFFSNVWPSYRSWFLCQGEKARADRATCREKLSRYLPELLPTYERLSSLAGEDELAVRFLSMVDPPPFMAGCSQVAWTVGEPALIRNYDYHPEFFEGRIVRTDWVQPVVGLSDCVWGLLDGVNAAGLSACLSFGGRKVIGSGFGIPLVVRYVLETCSNVAEAVRTLRRVPVHMAYNLTLIDAAANHATVYLSPDRDTIVTRDAVCTNHQFVTEWPEHAAFTRTVERRQYLAEQLDDPELDRAAFTRGFLEPPLYNNRYERGFGTLYTAVYEPSSRTLDLLWPSDGRQFGLDGFEAQEVNVVLEPASPEQERDRGQTEPGNRADSGGRVRLPSEFDPSRPDAV